MLPPLQATGGATSTIGMALVLGVGGYVLLEALGVDLWGAASGAVDTDSIFAGATSVNGLLVAGLAILAALTFGGVLGVGRAVALQLTAALSLASFALLLREFDAFDIRLFGIVAVGTVLIALSASGEPIIGAVVNSPAGPVLAIGGLYLGYRWLTSDDGKRIVVEGSVRQGGEE